MGNDKEGVPNEEFLEIEKESQGSIDPVVKKPEVEVDIIGDKEKATLSSKALEKIKEERKEGDLIRKGKAKITQEEKEKHDKLKNIRKKLKEARVSSEPNAIQEAA